MPKLKSAQHSTKITIWKAENYLKIRERKTRAQAPACLLAWYWVYWKLFYRFWPIKPCNFAHVVFPTLFSRVNFMLLSFRWICRRFLIKPLLDFSGPKTFWSVVTQGMSVKQSMYNEILIDYTTNCTSTNVQIKIKLKP